MKHLLNLMHNTAHPLNNTKGLVKLIKNELKNGNKNIENLLDMISKEQDNCMTILDNYYKQQHESL